jgi:hypothetical protein
MDRILGEMRILFDASLDAPESSDVLNALGGESSN